MHYNTKRLLVALISMIVIVLTSCSNCGHVVDLEEYEQPTNQYTGLDTTYTPDEEETTKETPSEVEVDELGQTDSGNKFSLTIREVVNIPQSITMTYYSTKANGEGSKNDRAFTFLFETGKITLAISDPNITNKSYSIYSYDSPWRRELTTEGLTILSNSIQDQVNTNNISDIAVCLSKEGLLKHIQLENTYYFPAEPKIQKSSAPASYNIIVRPQENRSVSQDINLANQIREAVNNTEWLEDRRYEIKRGENLTMIAKRYGQNYHWILDAPQNEAFKRKFISRGRVVYAGDVVWLPVDDLKILNH